MTTARDVVNRAMKRLAVLEATDSATGAEAKDALAALNDMMHAWKTQGIDVLHSDYTLNSTVAFFVPPKPAWVGHVEQSEGRLAKSLRALAYQGTWDASANSPALTSAIGTQGYAYKVSVAGSTTLDSVTSWAINDYLIFDGYQWLKCQAVAPFIQGLVAMLAVRLADDFGREVKPAVARDAENGWGHLLAQFMIPDQPTYDRGLSMMPSQRYINYS